MSYKDGEAGWITGQGVPDSWRGRPGGEHVEVLLELKGHVGVDCSGVFLPTGRTSPEQTANVDAALDAALAALSAPQPPADAHCTTCSCVPGMTPAVRFDATPAEQEGAVRDHLIHMGWTPPAEAQPDWGVAPPGATHYQPHQDAYYKRVSASEWYVWSREDDRELMRWLPSLGTRDNAEWVVRPAEAQAQGGGEFDKVIEDALRCGTGMLRVEHVPQAEFTAPPSAPVGVEAFVVRDYIGDDGPSIKGNGFDGLRIGEDRYEAEEFIRWVNARLAQQPASDGGFTAADMMDARQEGRKEAQQSAAVDEGWRKKAADWLEAKAVEQEANNQRWPDHAAAYKEWRDRPDVLRCIAAQVIDTQQGGRNDD